MQVWQRILNYINGIEPCFTHNYEITDTRDVGHFDYSWRYEITCVECRKKELLNKAELKKKWELGLVYLDSKVVYEIFGLIGNIQAKPERPPIQYFP